MLAHAQGRSTLAKQDRRRRRYLMEGSFAQAANLHHFKRARWRRLWRQQIQDWLIAAAQNIKLLLGAIRPAPVAAFGSAFTAGFAAASWQVYPSLLQRCAYRSVTTASIRFSSRLFGQRALTY